MSVSAARRPLFADRTGRVHPVGDRPGAPPVRRASVALTATLATTLAATGLALGAVSASAAPVPSAAPAGVPVSGAAGAAAWLDRQFRGPYIPTGTGAPDYSDTAQSVLALAASGTQRATVRAAMTYLERHVAAEISTTVGGKKVGDPGAIAFLILDAHATGGSARRFGGVNLVNQLLATMRPSGPDAGLLGAADPTFDGAYRQGLSLAALAGVATAPARLAPVVRWLQRQQCTSGGWEAYRANPSVACGPRDPKAYSGPDTNSTALAVEGLRAEGAAILHPSYPFLLSAQDVDGGWGYYGGPTDPDSTAVVRQALVALHQAHSPGITKPGGTPLSALRHFQLTAGPNAGVVTYPGTGPSLLATEQAGPALAGLAFPLAPPAASS